MNIYRSRSTGESSAKLGSCEECGRYTSDVWIQAHMERVTYDAEEFNVYRCYTFGHRECLKAKRTIPFQIAVRALSTTTPDG